jgi:hypothetical protein
MEAPVLKAKAKFNGRDVLILGLSHGNLDRLRADGPNGFIRIDGASLGLPLDIHITAAETERHLLDFFASKIGPDTQVKIDESLKS